MFFTGLFSSPVPYLILAIIYSISFGTYSVHLIKDKFRTKEEPAKEILHFQKKEIKRNTFIVSGYGITKQIQKHAGMDINQETIFISFTNRIKHILWPIRICSQIVNFGLFSRPPPLK